MTCLKKESQDRWPGLIMSQWQGQTIDASAPKVHISVTLHCTYVFTYFILPEQTVAGQHDVVDSVCQHCAVLTSPASRACRFDPSIIEEEEAPNATSDFAVQKVTNSPATPGVFERLFKPTPKKQVITVPIHVCVNYLDFSTSDINTAGLQSSVDASFQLKDRATLRQSL